MAKDKANRDGTPPDIHLVLNGKGRVGKSVVATWLAEFLVGRGRAARCIDGNPVNRSFSQYKALEAERLEPVNENGLIQGTVPVCCPRSVPSRARARFGRARRFAHCGSRTRDEESRTQSVRFESGPSMAGLEQEGNHPRDNGTSKYRGCWGDERGPTLSESLSRRDRGI